MRRRRAHPAARPAAQPLRFPDTVIIGMILGPLAEQEFRRAMTISQGDMLIFLQKPLSLTLLIVALLAVVGPQLWRLARGDRLPLSG